MAQRHHPDCTDALDGPGSMFLRLALVGWATVVARNHSVECRHRAAFVLSTQSQSIRSQSSATSSERNLLNLAARGPMLSLYATQG